MDEEKFMYLLDSKEAIETYIEAIKLGYEQGRKEGEDIGDIFLELCKKKGIKVECLGKTTMDSGLITGNLREEGKKVLNINEEIEKKKRQNNDK
jgi:hypothetical protein